MKQLVFYKGKLPKIRAKGGGTITKVFFFYLEGVAIVVKPIEKLLFVVLVCIFLLLLSAKPRSFCDFWVRRGGVNIRIKVREAAKKIVMAGPLRPYSLHHPPPLTLMSAWMFYQDKKFLKKVPKKCFFHNGRPPDSPDGPAIKKKCLASLMMIEARC